ncbi:hypothetical protein GSI_07311 [Ganoderma sinense ZZ0214-1]|uniref:MYND-type domain-containing protein n=1 Tax=Ganoderma sinense ZZ0214-1 TaxID=1077348 RepID=A0A2G8SA23_9APHY|nr:hypothetical protein GSI_07311 [Ganoderma sinense ZZ0214-1]
MSQASQPTALRFCNYCIRSPEDGIKLMRCTGCVDGPTYCSKACQKAHWSLHKVLCRSESSNKRLLENAPCAAPGMLHGFRSVEELTQTFNDYTGSHRWALQTAVIICTFLRTNSSTNLQGYGVRPDNVVPRFWFARATGEASTSRNPARTFAFTRMSWYEACRPKQLEGFAALHASSVALFRREDPDAPDATILALFTLEGGVHSALECFSYFQRYQIKSAIPRTMQESLTAPLKDLARMCVASLNTPFPIHTMPEGEKPGLPVPGRYVRENKSWVWKPLFKNWEDYFAGDTDCGPLVALEVLTSGLPPHYLISLFYRI